MLETMIQGGPSTKIGVTKHKYRTQSWGVEDSGTGRAFTPDRNHQGTSLEHILK